SGGGFGGGGTGHGRSGIGLRLQRTRRADLAVFHQEKRTVARESFSASADQSAKGENTAEIPRGMTACFLTCTPRSEFNAERARPAEDAKNGGGVVAISLPPFFARFAVSAIFALNINCGI